MLEIHLKDSIIYYNGYTKYLDLSVLNTEKVARYERWEQEDEEMERGFSIIGIWIDNKFHRYCGYNKFNSIPFDLDESKWASTVR